MTRYFLAVAGTAALVWFLFVLQNQRTRVTVLYAAGIILITAAAGVVSGPVTSLVARPAGVGLIGLAALSSPAVRDVGVLTLTGRWVSALCAPLAAYVVVTTAPHGEWTELALYLAALGLPLVLVVATGGHLALDDLRRGLLLGLSLTLAGSLVLGTLRPDLGVEGGRLRGLLENANGLGFMAFLLGAIAILVPTRWSRPALALSAGALVWSASRASTLALLVVVAFELVRRRRYGSVVGLVAVVVLALASTLLDVSAGPFDALLRSTDSRSSTFDASLADFRSSPLWGVGLDNESAIIASTAFRALSNGGILGLLCVTAQAVMILRASHVSYRAAAFATAGLMHSLFEGWLLSPSGPFLLTFAGVWLLIARHTGRPAHTEPVDDLPSVQVAASRMWNR